MNLQKEKHVYVYVLAFMFMVRVAPGLKMRVKFIVITPKKQILVKPTITKVEDHDRIYFLIASKNYKISNVWRL